MHSATTMTKNPAIIAVLLDAGADPNSQDTIGWTPLHKAAISNKNPAVIAAFLDAGADPKARDLLGKDAMGVRQEQRVAQGLRRLLAVE